MPIREIRGSKLHPSACPTCPVLSQHPLRPSPSRPRVRLPLRFRPSNQTPLKSPSPLPTPPPSPFRILLFTIFNSQFPRPPPATTRLTTGVGRRKAAFRGMTVDPLARQRGTESGLRRCSTFSSSPLLPPKTPALLSSSTTSTPPTPLPQLPRNPLSTELLFDRSRS